MNGKKYKQILIHHMRPSARRLFGDDYGDNFMFEQDNDPKHTAHIIRNYFRNQGLVVIDWSSQSPDLNPIENLWFILDRQLKQRKPSNEAELFDILQAKWDDFKLDTLRSLIHRMRRRCQAVIHAKGFPTKYSNCNCNILFSIKCIFSLISKVETFFFRIL